MFKCLSMGMYMRMFLRMSSIHMHIHTQKHIHILTHFVNVHVNANVNGNRRAARNGRNEKQENEKLITVTVGHCWGINFELQLQSCLRRRINIGLQLPSGPLQELKNVIIIARMVLFKYCLHYCSKMSNVSITDFNTVSKLFSSLS